MAGVVLGLLLTAGVAFAVVTWVQGRVMEEALQEQGHDLEGHFAALVDRFAAQEFGAGGQGLPALAQRLVTAAQGNPVVLDAAVVDGERRPLARFPADAPAAPCFLGFPLDQPVDHQHPAGTRRDEPVGCISLPIRQDGRLRGAVQLHTLRPWVAEGSRAGQLVWRSALSIAPVFLASTLVFAGLLVVASRAARRWRLEAAAARRVEALGAMACGVSHELKNPLNAVSLSLQFLERRYTDAETREVVDGARRQTSLIGERLEEFARFARLLDLAHASLDLGAILARGAAAAGVPLEVQGHARASGDAQRVERAIAEIFTCLAVHRDPSTSVRVALREGGAGTTLEFRVRAAALGAEEVEPLFDPWVRPRPGDVGRGLAFARAVFEAHGGGLEAARRGNGLALIGRLPKREG